MPDTDRERRAICRECSRGADAPHKHDCQTGRVRAARTGFSIHKHAAAMLAARTERIGRDH